MALPGGFELVEFINAERKAAGNKTDLQHNDFMKKVPKVLGETVAGNFSHYYVAENGKENPCYRFPKREVPKVLGEEVARNFSHYYVAENGKENPCYRFPVAVCGKHISQCKMRMGSYRPACLALGRDVGGFFFLPTTLGHIFFFGGRYGGWPENTEKYPTESIACK